MGKKGGRLDGEGERAELRLGSGHRVLIITDNTKQTNLVSWQCLY